MVEKGLLSMSARLFFVLLVGTVIVSVNLSPAFATGATITTDKTKYSLGETMTITGAGFIPDALVTITVLRPDQVTDTLPTATADAQGGFVTTYTPRRSQAGTRSPQPMGQTRLTAHQPKPMLTQTSGNAPS